MERRLSVEDNIIVVHQVALDGITDFEMLIGPVGKHRQVYVVAVGSLDVLCAGPVVGTSVYEFAETGMVVLGDYFRLGQVHGDLDGDTKLVQTQIGVRCDDRTG